VLLVLDDLDSADEPSQLLARHVARTAQEDRLLLVVTCRGTAGPLATLAQEPNTTRLQLGGLDRVAVARHVATIVGRDPSDDEVGAVYEATAGNPFFVSELARQLADGSGLPVAVPRSVLDAMGLRLDQLTPDCAALLQSAAIVGSEFEVDVLATVAARPVLECLASLDEAARCALVVPGTTPGRRRFAHDLVRDAIVANLDATRRVDLHRRAAEALEQHHAGRLQPVLFDLAQHWAEAAVAGDRGRAVSWIERAGREAMRQHAYEDGRGWFTTALAIGETGQDDVSRCRLMLALATAQSLSADLLGALETCQQVVDFAIGLGRADLAGEAALAAEPTFDPDIDQIMSRRSRCSAPPRPPSAPACWPSTPWSATTCPTSSPPARRSTRRWPWPWRVATRRLWRRR
jgi:predicted ATPase